MTDPFLPARREQRPPRVLVSGWYGFGNVGDEAILQAVADRFRRDLPGAEITALSYRPAYTRRVQGLPAAHPPPFTARSWASWLVKGRWARTLLAFARCDLFVMGGGGFLSDWQPEVPAGWLKQFRLAKALGKRTRLFGIGAGPFRTEAGREAVRHYVNGYVDDVVVRDHESRAALVEDCGVDASKVRVEIDPVATMDVSAWRDPHARPDAVGIVYAGYFDRPIFGDAQARWPVLRERFVEQVAQVRAAGFPVRLIFFQPEAERALAADLGAATGAPCVFPADWRDAVRELSRCRGLISFRLHGAILAHAMGLPCLPIVYHPKGLGFLTMAGYHHPEDRIVVGDGINLPQAPLDAEQWARRTDRFLDRLPAARDA